MRRITRMVLGAGVAAALSVTLAAQQAPVNTYRVYCVNVKSGQDAAFDSFVNGDLHKLAQAWVDSGDLSGFIAMQTVLPAGKKSECDYVFLDFYSGTPKAPMTDAEFTAAAQRAGVSMTPEQWGEKLDQTAELVSSSLELTEDLVGGAEKGDYIVYNSMKVSDMGAWISWEKKMWDPLAQSMVKSGQLSGWALNIQTFPRGARDEGRESTSDIFPSWDAFAKSYENDEAAWKTVHPNDDMNTAMDQFSKLCTIQHQVLYKVVDEIMGK